MSPFATTRCHGSASAKSHWIVPGSAGALRVLDARARASGTAPPSSRDRSSAGRSSRRARRPARGAGRSHARLGSGSPYAKIGGPGQLLDRQTRRCAASSRATRALRGDVLQLETEHLACSRGSSPAAPAPTPSTAAPRAAAPRPRAGTPGRPPPTSESSFTPNAMWRCSSWAIRSIPSRKPGSRSRSCRYDGDEVLSGLRERRLDHDVVERDRRGQARQRGVRAQLGRHPLEPVEHLPEAPCQLAARSLPVRRATVPSPIVADLVHEAVKKTAWRASSTCWVARKYFCSSVGAASM